jgi:hypothetical protein
MQAWTNRFGVVFHNDQGQIHHILADNIHHELNNVVEIWELI